eukprot:GEMP01063234.1.p1 GENE.GEMP01063234.1~~GEMP01063234.1.p1  ORF type:complete len:291 (+),score=33.60 GEMP01063234.1:219-1091(+)
MSLYVNDPNKADNEEDQVFIPSLRVNRALRLYTFRGLLLYPCLRISQQVATAFIFYVVWDRLRLGEIHPYVLFAFVVCSMGIATPHYSLPDSMSVVTVFSLQWILAPVNLTLTLSWSEDTVLKLGFWFLVLHVLCFDYVEVEPSCGLAVNAAFFAAMILASRLGDATHVFAFTSFAFVVFGFAPLFCRGHGWSVVLIIIAFFLSWSTAKAVCCSFISCMVLINLVSPSLFIYLLRHKEFVEGSWDIPIVCSPRASMRRVSQLLSEILMGEEIDPRGSQNKTTGTKIPPPK